MDDNVSIFRGIQRSLQDFEQPLKIAIFYVLILDSEKPKDFCPGIVCDLFYQYPPSIWVEFCEAGVGHWITLRILWNHPRRPCFKLTLVVIVIPQSHKDKTCLHLFFFCYAFSTCFYYHCCDLKIKSITAPLSIMLVLVSSCVPLLTFDKNILLFQSLV